MLTERTTTLFVSIFYFQKCQTRDSKSYDYVLRIHNRSVKDDFLIVKYLPKEHQWICLYTFQMHADWNYVIEGHFTHHRHHEIIICGIFGSGHFLAGSLTLNS